MNSDARSRPRRWRRRAACLAMPLTLAALTACWAVAARGPQWWAVALRSPMFIRCGIVLMVCAVALQVVLTVLFRLGRGPGPFRPGEQRGTAMLEFVLLFPIAMAIVLVMVQAAQLMKGNLFVHYAAFAAARAAVVQIPRPLPEEPRNWLAEPGQSEKLERIRWAAMLAVLPVAGNLPDAATRPADEDLFLNGIEAFHAAYGRDAPNWVTRKFADQYAYADAHTDVRVAPPADEQTGIYGEREDIRVTVRHELHLALPYVGRLLGQPLAGSPGEYFSEVYASYVLVNQGRPDTVWYEYRVGDDVKRHIPPPPDPGEEPWLPR